MKNYVIMNTKEKKKKFNDKLKSGQSNLGYTMFFVKVLSLFIS